MARTLTCGHFPPKAVTAVVLSLLQPSVVRDECAARDRSTRMRTLAITQNITLDGSIEMLDPWFDAQTQGDMADLLAEQRRQRETVDTLLCGRRTFTTLRSYWRDLANDTTGISDYLNRVDKRVVSSTLTDPDWDRATVLAGNPGEQIQALKEQPGKDIVLTGSINLTHTLITAGLVDQYRLFVYPAVQGRGRRLFPDVYETSQLRLLSSMSFHGGIALLTYTCA